MKTEREKSKLVHFDCPEDLIAELDEIAAEHMLTRTSLLIIALAKLLEALERDSLFYEERNADKG